MWISEHMYNIAITYKYYLTETEILSAQRDIDRRVTSQ
jgi:hypothetical protein